ncbi:protein serine/threonine phosphatase 2C [Gymnopus androsaceus JB14]|uniref:Protein serine/threonine phosphatase 2C n=1 Tax=Gymnopus androsaceus JB14 TaxID=1447944 RepID=A0A6A4I1R5_9AGAR|nr:protein serine/threonine phosphatase 2C [Gymnopus androsaceus JB14]
MSSFAHINSPSVAHSFLEKCTFSTSISDGARNPQIQYAQFRGTPNEDRFAISEEWELGSHVWQFLAVFDGHGGPTNAEYLANNFPSHIRQSMERVFSETRTQQQQPDIVNNVFTEKAVSDFLKRQVREFDDGLGNAVKALCPNPAGNISDKEARELYRVHKEVITRARCGSTMASVLIDKSENRMWVCCVGDSSVVLSCKNSTDSERKRVLLNTHHTGHTPREYHRVTLEHPSHERGNIWLDEERIFGTLSMTRSFGDFMYKLPAFFTAKLFCLVPSTAMKSVESVLKYNRTPPYVIADPFVGFVDLAGVVSKDENPTVIIYTDGLEALAYKLSTLLVKGTESSAPSPVDVVGAFLGQPLHPSTWAPSKDYTDASPGNNEAFALMYNLFTKAIPDKLGAHLMANGNDSDKRAEDLYIDDVTVLVFRPFPTSNV